MNTGYRFRMFLTDLLLIGLYLFVILKGLQDYEPKEDNVASKAEIVMDTETE